jgi:hypothetical protein
MDSMSGIYPSAGRGLRSIRTRITKEWRKKTVRPIIMRMRRTWNSWEME